MEYDDEYIVDLTSGLTSDVRAATPLAELISTTQSSSPVKSPTQTEAKVDGNKVTFTDSVHHKAAVRRSASNADLDPSSAFAVAVIGGNVAAIITQRKKKNQLQPPLRAPRSGYDPNQALQLSLGYGMPQAQPASNLTSPQAQPGYGMPYQPASSPTAPPGSAPPWHAPRSAWPAALRRPQATQPGGNTPDPDAPNPVTPASLWRPQSDRALTEAHLSERCIERGFEPRPSSPQWAE